MNFCSHTHLCFECAKPYTCFNPECIELEGKQGLCPTCSYMYGWSQNKERRTRDDSNAGW